MTNNEIYEEDKEAEPKYVDVSNTETNIRFCGMMTTIVLGFSILTLIAVVLSNIMINSKLDQSQKDMVEISKGISMLGSDISDLKAILYYVTSDPIYDPEVSPANPTPTPNSCTVQPTHRLKAVGLKNKGTSNTCYPFNPRLNSLSATEHGHADVSH